MYRLQVQGTTAIEAMQAVRLSSNRLGFIHSLRLIISLTLLLSFELGGDKKTKGAALTFVRYSLFYVRIRTSNVDKYRFFQVIYLF